MAHPNVNSSGTALAQCTDALPSGNVQDLSYGFSGLDEFGARYYSSSLDRFMIPDWLPSRSPSPTPSFPNRRV